MEVAVEVRAVMAEKEVMEEVIQVVVVAAVAVVAAEVPPADGDVNTTKCIS